MSDQLLELERMSVRFLLGRRGAVRAVTDASLSLRPGQVTALIGESGCGKSVLAAALLGLLPANAQVRGRALLADGTDLLSASDEELTQVRGRQVGLVPQSAATHLTPVRTARSQLAETVRELGGRRGVEELALQVGLRPEQLDHYPHELSGGMAQRVALALALAGDPPLLIADEPTTGLDRPLVERTVDLLAEAAGQDRAVLLITHDLAAARRVATDVAVMYASRIVESGPADKVFADPWHPYTAGLLRALPENGFQPIPGQPPVLSELDEAERKWGCVFCQRCPDVPGVPPCNGNPDLVEVGDRRVAAHPPC
ncbi:ABC transporter ATP-binding protein [Saccharopolyspora rectivirgula]|uniref:Nickel import system ATP-binding protein NikD n=1 Tax=Saccharopolyspora rectivirgula TaxID=28042 RepID=A0A073AZH3_9PSEU|nr:ABC transporter ATP-binding protein [Saccharopolyspora rectivirgula]KEI44462.1 peptide ABC transporter ATP-binding protein [Saccharopolyspora rectivirgula]